MAARKRRSSPALPPERAALLRAILDAPDEDGPRLVYADWLEENGGEGERAHAELIRVQCEADRLGEYDPRRLELELRGRSLLAANADHLLAGLPTWVGKEQVRFRRGFLTELSATALAFARDGEALCAAAPLEGARMRLTGVQLNALLAAPALARLRRLALHKEGLRHDELIRLFNAPGVASLRELELSNNWVNYEASHVLGRSPSLRGLRSLLLSDAVGDWLGVEAVLTGPNAAGLRRLALRRTGVLRGVMGPFLDACARLTDLEDLDLSHGSLGDEPVAQLAWSALLPRLKRLDLSANNLTTAGVRILAQRHALTVLGLGGNRPGDEGIAALVGAPAAAGLVRLDLPPGSRQGWEALARSPHLSNLTDLRLSYHRPGPGAGALLASASLPALGRLELRQCHLTTDDAVALAGSALLGQLFHLDLTDHSDIGPEGWRALAESPRAADLVSLELTGCWIGPEAASALARSGKLPRLRRLGLWNNGLGDSGAWAFASSPASAGLIELDLRHNDITDIGARALAESPHLSGLAELLVGDNPIGLAGVEALRARFGRRLRTGHDPAGALLP